MREAAVISHKGRLKLWLYRGSGQENWTGWWGWWVSLGISSQLPEAKSTRRGLHSQSCGRASKKKVEKYSSASLPESPTQPEPTVHSVGTPAEKGDSRKILRDSPANLMAQCLRGAPKAQKEAEREQPTRWTSRKAGRKRRECLDGVHQTPEKSLSFTHPPEHRGSHPSAWVI